MGLVNTCPTLSCRRPYFLNQNLGSMVGQVRSYLQKQPKRNRERRVLQKCGSHTHGGRPWPVGCVFPENRVGRPAAGPGRGRSESAGPIHAKVAAGSPCTNPGGRRLGWTAPELTSPHTQGSSALHDIVRKSPRSPAVRGSLCTFIL